MSSSIILPSNQETPTSGLQSDYVTSEMFELVAEDPGPDHGLHPHEASSHLSIFPPAIVGTECLLDLDGGLSHLEEPSPVIPSSDTPL